MASNRKPLSETTRHMTVAERQEKQQAEDMISSVSSAEIMKPPSWLSKVAKEEWKRILPQLLSIDIVGNLDLANIAGYCQAYSNYRRATEALNATNLVIQVVDEESGNSYVKANPWLRAQTDSAVEMRKFADLCGMTISSRLKAATTKLQDKQANIVDEFGDI